MSDGNGFKGRLVIEGLVYGSLSKDGNTTYLNFASGAGGTLHGPDGETWPARIGNMGRVVVIATGEMGSATVPSKAVDISAYMTSAKARGAKAVKK